MKRLANVPAPELREILAGSVGKQCKAHTAANRKRPFEATIAHVAFTRAGTKVRLITRSGSTITVSARQILEVAA